MTLYYATSKRNGKKIRKSKTLLKRNCDDNGFGRLFVFKFQNCTSLFIVVHFLRLWFFFCFSSDYNLNEVVPDRTLYTRKIQQYQRRSSYTRDTPVTYLTGRLGRHCDPVPSTYFYLFVWLRLFLNFNFKFLYTLVREKKNKNKNVGGFNEFISNIETNLRTAVRVHARGSD